MIWVLYIIVGLSANPSLQQIATYKDEQVCRKAAQDLKDSNVRSVCLPKEKNNG